jgi:hypothetical protein
MVMGFGSRYRDINAAMDSDHWWDLKYGNAYTSEQNLYPNFLIIEIYRMKFSRLLGLNHYTNLYPINPDR